MERDRDTEKERQIDKDRNRVRRRKKYSKSGRTNIFPIFFQRMIFYVIAFIFFQYERAGPMQ